jgi:hypothetical protein
LSISLPIELGNARGWDKAGQGTYQQALSHNCLPEKLCNKLPDQNISCIQIPCQLQLYIPYNAAPEWQASS